MRTLALFSIKGGVGKSTAAVNLADEAARGGVRVLLWDLDPQGAASFSLRTAEGVKGGVSKLLGPKGSLGRHVRATDRPGLHLVPADVSLRHLDVAIDRLGSGERLVELLAPLEPQYDLVVLDCPPGVTSATPSVFAAVDVLLVPTVPTPLSTRALTQLAEVVAASDPAPRLLAFASMVDRRKKLQRESLAELHRTVDGFSPTVIPNASVIERMGTERAPVAAYAQRSPAAAAFADLWTEVAGLLWER